MEYDIRDITEEVDYLVLSREEFANLNRVYKEGLKKRGFDRNISDMTRIIITDGYRRMEFMVEKNENT